MKLKRFTLFCLSLISTSLFSSAGFAATPSQAQASASQQEQTFLKANAHKPGVVTLADGLQYKILKEGKGARPNREDIVTVNYAGRLLNGTEFDSSFKRNQPAVFRVDQVIPGWTEILQLMPIGSSWEVYIPAKLAYGEQGAPPAIGPNELLIFTIDLLAVDTAD